MGAELAAQVAAQPAPGSPSPASAASAVLHHSVAGVKPELPLNLLSVKWML